MPSRWTYRSKAEDNRLGIRRGRVAGPQANVNLHPPHRLLRGRSQGRPGLAVENIQGALDLLLADHGHLGVDRGRLQLGMTQEFLDIADVGAMLKKMGRRCCPPDSPGKPTSSPTANDSPLPAILAGHGREIGASPANFGSRCSCAAAIQSVMAVIHCWHRSFARLVVRTVVTARAIALRVVINQFTVFPRPTPSLGDSLCDRAVLAVSEVPRPDPILPSAFLQTPART